MSQSHYLASSKQSRARVFRYVAVALFAVIVGRLFLFQVWHGRAYSEQARHNRVRLEILPRIRGEILDRHGRVLAENVLSYCLLFDPFEKEFVSGAADVDEVLTSTAALGGGERLEEWRALIEKGRELPFRPVQLACNLDITQISLIEEHKSRLPGMRIEARPRRSYPHGELACHLLGYVSEARQEEIERSAEGVYQPGDMVGRSGVEESREVALRGRNGKEYVEVDARGRRVEPTPDRPPLPARERPWAGSDVVLTVDLDLQRAAEAALGEERSGAVVVLDPRDGAVLAMASRPGFDPNVFALGLSPGRWRKLNSSPLHPLMNRATQALYPPGSTLKLLTAAAAMEEGVANPATTLEPCTGVYRFGTRGFRCWREEGHGILTLLEAVEASCDVYFYQLGIRLGVDRMAEYARRFGLRSRTGVELQGEKSGFYPTTQWYDKTYGHGRWGKGVRLNLAIGQGEILVTPLGLAVFAASIANGGTLYRPYVVASQVERWDRSRSARRPGRVTPRASPGVSSVTLKALRQAMEAAVSGPLATGRMASVPGIRVAGKTGTAQNPHGQDHALFVGFAPVEAPEVAFAVVVENAGHGGSVAAPVAAAVLRSYFHIQPDTVAVAQPGDTLDTAD
ncbi:MAG: penicillin-binding protein 2 [Candidatus Eisenbacteria bacterium]|nr:penicillin-binding protein 2 [Candidatus Eisenbacteria bacterium]